MASAPMARGSEALLGVRSLVRRAASGLAARVRALQGTLVAAALAFGTSIFALDSAAQGQQASNSPVVRACWIKSRSTCVMAERKNCLAGCGKLEDCPKNDSDCRNTFHKCANLCRSSKQNCEWGKECVQTANKACAGFPADLVSAPCS